MNNSKAIDKKTKVRSHPGESEARNWMSQHGSAKRPALHISS